MTSRNTSREAIEGVIRLEREVIALYRRVAEHEKRAHVGARLQILEARHLSAASRSERLLEDVRHQEGGGVVGDVAAQISDALVSLFSSVPVELIEETHTPTFSTLKRFEGRLLECYESLADEIGSTYREEVQRGADESRANLEELEAMESAK